MVSGEVLTFFVPRVIPFKFPQPFINPFRLASVKQIEAEPDLTKQLQELENAIDAASSVEIDNYFVEGFKIGLLIGIEASEPYEPKGL